MLARIYFAGLFFYFVSMYFFSGIMSYVDNSYDIVF